MASFGEINPLFVNRLHAEGSSGSVVPTQSWVEKVAIPRLKQKLIEQSEGVQGRISNPKEREKALSKFKFLIKNLVEMEGDLPTTLDGLAKGLFKGFDKSFRKIASRTDAKKARRDIYVFHAVTELRSLIVDDYLDNRTGPKEELREYLVANLFKMALPSLHEKNLKVDLCKQVAARALLSTAGVSGGGEESTAAVEANPYVHKKNVSPAPDPMLNEVSNIQARIHLLQKQISSELKSDTLDEARLSFYESEIARLEEKVNELNNSVNKTAQAVIVISIATASIAILHRFRKEAATSISLKGEQADKLEKILSLITAAAPMVATGLGTGIHVWNVKRKAGRLKSLENEEKLLYQRSALLHLLLKGKAEKVAFLEEGSSVCKMPKWEPSKSLEEHQEIFREAKDAHLFGLHELLDDSKDVASLDLAYTILEAGAKKLGLSDEHFSALIEVIRKTPYDERAELFETLMTIVATLHQSVLEQKKQGKVNFRVAEGNLGVNAGSFAITTAKIAGLAIPYTAPIVATALVVSGAAAAYSSYKTQKFSKRQSELTRKEVTFKEIIQLTSPNPLAKEALLLLAGIPLEQQREARAVFLLHMDE